MMKSCLLFLTFHVLPELHHEQVAVTLIHPAYNVPLFSLQYIHLYEILVHQQKMHMHSFASAHV